MDGMLQIFYTCISEGRSDTFLSPPSLRFSSIPFLLWNKSNLKEKRENATRRAK